MAGLASIDEMNRLLLMAAGVHGLGPGTDLGIANSAKVVGQALRWSGLMDDEVLRCWGECEYCPAIRRCYGALIAMIRHEPESEAFFEGNGNFGSATSPRAFPHFTSCRLTARGLELSEKLLARHPEFR